MVTLRKLCKIGLGGGDDELYCASTFRSCRRGEGWRPLGLVQILLSAQELAAAPPPKYVLVQAQAPAALVHKTTLANITTVPPQPAADDCANIYYNHYCHLNNNKSCFLCNKQLRPDKDVYMYKGDLGFCSQHCRNRQIYLDETSCSFRHDHQPNNRSSSSSFEGDHSSRRRSRHYSCTSDERRRETRLLLRELRHRRLSLNHPPPNPNSPSHCMTPSIH